MTRIEVSRPAAAEVAKLAIVWGGRAGRLRQAEVVDRILSEWKQAKAASLEI